MQHITVNPAVLWTIQMRTVWGRRTPLGYRPNTSTRVVCYDARAVLSLRSPITCLPPLNPLTD